MADAIDFRRRWEVRPTLRLANYAVTDDTPRGILDGIANALHEHPNVTYANVGLERSPRSVGVTATIVLARTSTPGEAVDEATNLLAGASAAAGLMTDVIKDVVVEMADVDPRAL